jgi:hypothetical protein
MFTGNIAGGERHLSRLEMLLNRLSYFALTLRLLEVKRRVSPAECANIELMHSFDIEINLVGYGYRHPKIFLHPPV